MKNIYLIDYYNPIQNNGLNSYIAQLSNALSSSNDIALSIVWMNANIYAEITEELKDNINHIFIPFDINTPNNIDLDRTFIDFIKNHCKGKSNIIFHFNWINHSSFSEYLKKEINCKTLLTKHCVPYRDHITRNDLIYQYIETAFEQNIESFAIKNTLSRDFLAFHSIDHIITVTEDAKNILTSLFSYPNERISLIYNGINHSSFYKPTKKEKKELRKKYGFEANKKIILFAGNLSERKGVLDLLKTFNILSENNLHNYHLIICGQGNYEPLYSIIKQYGNVTITGNLAKEKLYDFYKLADIGIVPSYAEQCSYTMIEMMSSHLPIIVSPVGGLNEIINNDRGYKTKLIINENNRVAIDIDDLATLIESVFNNYSDAEEKASYSQKHAYNHLNDTKMLDSTLSVYEQLLSNNSFSTQYLKPDNTNTPLVSIILPCYNSEKHIRECIESIINQHYTNWELIIINDSSTDNTKSIIKNFNDSRIKILENKTHKKLPFSLNLGINASNGKYISCFDSDDIMLPHRLQRQVEFLESNNDYTLVGSNNFVINSFGKKIGINFFPQTNEEIQSFKFLCNPFSDSSVMIKSDVLKQFKFTKNYPHNEYYELWLKILEYHKGTNIQDSLTINRIRENNISKMQNESSVELTLNSISNIISINKFEIKIHGAILMKYGNKYFISKEKNIELDSWISKIYSLTPKTIEKNNFIKDIKLYFGIL